MEQGFYHNHVPQMKGHVNPKIHIFLILCKTWYRIRNRNSFLPIRLLLGRKSAFLTEIPLPVKTIARGRDVSGGTKILRNMVSSVELIGQLVRVAIVRTMSFSEESDSNTLNS